MQPHEREIRHFISDGKDVFGDWIANLKDAVGRLAINKRLYRVAEGNFGDRRFVGAGVWELRIHSGPGYRVYYGEDGPALVLLLCGGDKRTQWQDILRAQKFWGEHRRSR